MRLCIAVCLELVRDAQADVVQIQIVDLVIFVFRTRRKALLSNFVNRYSPRRTQLSVTAHSAPAPNVQPTAVKSSSE